MVALLTRLQLKLTIRSYRGSTARIVGLIVLSLYAAFIIFALMLGAVALSMVEQPMIGTITTVFFAVVTLVWPTIALLLGNSDALAPVRFSLLPVCARQLQLGLLVATTLTLGGIITILMGLGYLIAWSRQGLAFWVAVVAMILGVGFAILLVRTLTTAMSALLASRKFRDWAVVILGVLLTFVLGGLQFLSQGLGISGAITAQQLEVAGRVAGWTPLGWIWSLPWEAVNEQWTSMAIKLALITTTSAILWVVWRRLLDRALTSPMETGMAKTRIRGGGRLEAWLPQNPAGAVAVRTLRYWARDPRRKVQGMSLLVLPLAFGLTTRNDWDGGVAVLFVGPATMAFAVVSLVMAEISFDGSALATQILSRASGRDDRVGRAIAMLMLLVPFGVVIALASLFLSGRWDHAAVTLAATIGTAAIGAGVGSWAGAMWNYSVPPSGMGINSRGNLGAAVGMLLAMLVELVLLLPLGAAALASGSYAVMAWVSPALSLSLGAVVLWVGVIMGGRHLDQTWPEVLTRITWTRS